MSAKKARTKKKLDTALATRGVWLLKVPNYLAESWSDCPGHQELGVMTIRSHPKKKVEFLLCPQLCSVVTPDASRLQLPQEHKVMVQEASSQCLSVFSEDSVTGSVSCEGQISQRADVQPLDCSLYMTLKKHQIRAAEKTRFTAQHLKVTPTSSYKPKDRHAVDVKHGQKKPDQLKRARDEREVVYDLLFSAFQHHQYYSFKDLVSITKQPPVYLKEILKEVCVYNTKAPHKYMWELKPEYRHSKDPAVQH